MFQGAGIPVQEGQNIFIALAVIKRKNA